MLWMPSTSSALTKFASVVKISLISPSAFLKSSKLGILRPSDRFGCRRDSFQAAPASPTCWTTGPAAFRDLARAVGHFGFDVDGLAILVDSLDLVLRERLAHGDIGRKAQIDEHFCPRRIVVETVGDPLVEFARSSPTRSAMRSAALMMGLAARFGLFSVGYPLDALCEWRMADDLPDRRLPLVRRTLLRFASWKGDRVQFLDGVKHLVLLLSVLFDLEMDEPEIVADVHLSAVPHDTETSMLPPRDRRR